MRQGIVDGVNDVAHEVLDRLEAQVQHQLSGRLLGFRLKRQDEGVILIGRASSYYAKQLAQHAVMRVIDIPILQNEIEVS
jgi:hypothetical protein